MYTETVLQKPV